MANIQLPTVPFSAGSPILVTGPTSCGKTVWINHFLSHPMFNEEVTSILYCYGVHQPFFEEMKKSSTLVAPISFHEGLPDIDKIDSIADGKFHIIVLDDLMEDIVRSADMLKLFTKYCHHHNISAIFVSQNIFQQGKYSRSISLNCHIIVLFSNKRDESQIATLARQIYPDDWKRFLKAYKMSMNSSYAYLVVDCSPSQKREIKVRTNIFPGETTCTFDI